MNSRLVAVSGALTGEVLPLANDDPVSLGRDASNRIPISDVSVSRRHCAIMAERGQYVIRDLDSRNGTFVNELPVRERVLEDGDQIRIGESVFLFLASWSGAEGSELHRLRYLRTTQSLTAPLPGEFCRPHPFVGSAARQMAPGSNTSNAWWSGLSFQPVRLCGVNPTQYGCPGARGPFM